MGIGPAFAIRKLLAATGLTLADIDLLEVNEAFAGQVLAVGRELDWDESRVNVNGGAIAMGHPLGASGTRIAVTLLHEMQRRVRAARNRRPLHRRRHGHRGAPGARRRRCLEQALIA